MRKVLLILSIMVAVTLFNTTGFASVNDDQVTSQKIKEADGTSGQNTNSGSGVKTGHIQNDAVATSKIADSAVTSGKIADGAVTDAKITGPISSSKISSTGLNSDTVDGLHAADLAPAVHSHPQSQVTGLEAALVVKSDVTHNHDVLYQQKYGKVAVVAQTGGDYSDPVAAMNDTSTWCGTPSATNACLLKIMPGTYALGNTLQMKSYVDVEGAGANTTKLSGSVDYFYSDHNELRMLTVENAGTAIYLQACDHCGIRDASVVAGYEGIHAEYAANATLRHVNIIVTAGTPGGSVTGIWSLYPNNDMLIEDSVISVSGASMADAAWGFNGYFGVIGRADLFIKNSKILVTAATVCYGISTGPYDTFVTESDVVAEGSPQYSWGFINNITGNVTVKNSTIKASAELFSNGNIKIANTRLEGPAIVNKTSLKCFGVYDGNYDPFVCQ